MKGKVLQNYKELVNLLDKFDSRTSTPPLVMIQINPANWSSIESVTRSEKSLTIVNEHICQPEGIISVITSDGFMLSESQITI